MKTVERCQKFAKEALEILSQKGECLESAQLIATAAGKITNNLSDKTLKKCQWAGGVLDVKTVVEISIWSRHAFNEEPRTDAWEEAKEILRELAGLEEIKTHQRERDQWTWHWKFLYQGGDDKMKKEVIKTAKKMYKDFDLSLLEVKNEGS